MVWNCSACTFENAATASRCAICETARPPVPVSVPFRPPPTTTTTRPMQHSPSPSPSPSPPTAAKPAVTRPLAALGGPGAGGAIIVGTPPEPSREDLAYFTSMGFNYKDAWAALRQTHCDREAALSVLTQPKPVINSTKPAVNSAATPSPASSAPSASSLAQAHKPVVTTTPSATSTANKISITPSSSSAAAAAPPTANKISIPTTTASSRPAVTSAPAQAKISIPPSTAASSISTSQAKPAAAAAAATTPAAASSVTASSPQVKKASMGSGAAAAVALRERAFEEREQERLRLQKLYEEEQKQKLHKLKEAKEKEKSKATPATAAAAPVTASSVAAASNNKSSSTVISTPAAHTAASTSTTRDAETEEERRKRERFEAEIKAREERKKELEERVHKRLEIEKSFKDIPSVINYLRSAYDLVRFESILALLSKILTNIITVEQSKATEKDSKKLAELKNNSEKFRTIKLDNPKIEFTLVRPHGALSILKQIGFVESTRPRTLEEKSELVKHTSSLTLNQSNKTTTSQSNSSWTTDDDEQTDERILYLAERAVDLQKLSHAFKLLQQQGTAALPKPTNIIPLVTRMRAIAAGEKKMEEKDASFSHDSTQQLLSHIQIKTKKFDPTAPATYSNEGIYLMLVELRDIVQNVIAAPEDRNFCSIDLTSITYQTRLGFHAPSSASSSSSSSPPSSGELVAFSPILEGHAILADLGFVPSKHGHGLWFSLASTTPDLNRMTLALREINHEIVQVKQALPITIHLSKLAQANKKKSMIEFITLINGALDKVVEFPHEQKYHRLNLSKIEAKTQIPVEHQRKFLRHVGFLLVTEETNGIIAALPYPGFTSENIAIRREVLNSVWNELLQKAEHERSLNGDDAPSIFD